MAADRIDDEELLLTQEFLAMMLGVRRLGVTVALQELETKGLIRRRRGKIVIRDREILKSFPTAHTRKTTAFDPAGVARHPKPFKGVRKER